MEKYTLDSNIYMLIGTYTSADSKGIYVYKMDTVTGECEYVSEVGIENPSYLVLGREERFVYSVTENEDDENSFVSAFSFDKKEGKLNFINKQSTQGGAPCYINTDKTGHHALTANYLGGSVTVFSVNDDGSLNPATQVLKFTGKGINEERQEQPHLHCVEYSPNGRHLYATDLGTDKIYNLIVNSEDSVNYISLGVPESFVVKGGSGPRHLKFHPNEKYAYLLTELSGDVIVFDVKDNMLEEKQTIKADTLNAGGSADIQISADGKYLYASNRLKGDGIAIFSIHQTDGRLTKVAYQETGVHPRNFAITPNDKFLLVANRDSDNIQIFKRNLDTGLLINTGNSIQISMPVCIRFASIY